MNTKEFATEGKKILVSAALMLLIFSIAFYKSAFTSVLLTVLGLLWLFVLPGWAVTLYWHDKLNFTQRILAGILIIGSLNGVLSYYGGLIGFNVNAQAHFWSVLWLLVGLTIAKVKKHLLTKTKQSMSQH